MAETTGAIPGTNLDALIESGPAGGAVAPGKFLGVPDTYVAPTIQDRLPNSVGTPGVAVQPFKLYAEGEQYSPAVGKNAAQIAEMQQDLVDAGVYPKGVKFKMGVWDNATASAYKKVLEFSNQQGLDAAEAIDTLKNSPTYDADAASQSLQYELPDRETVKAIVGKASRSVLGRGLDDASKDAIATAYEAEVMRVQQQNFQQQAIDGAKTYAPIDKEVFAAQQIRKQNPGEAQAHDYSNVYNGFSELLAKSTAGAQTSGSL